MRNITLISEYIALSRESLSELFSQKERLKGVQRKVYDILNYLGKSNSIIRAVEKREIVDKYLVYVGMVVVTGLLLFVYLYLR